MDDSRMVSIVEEGIVFHACSLSIISYINDSILYLYNTLFSVLDISMYDTINTFISPVSRLQSIDGS